MAISRGKVAGPRKLLLYGDHGAGKSTFASKSYNPVFIDIEGSTNDLDVDRWTEREWTYTKLVNALAHFRSADHGFNTLVIDTIDWGERLVFSQISGQAGVSAITDIDFGKGLPRAIPMWEYILKELNNIHKERQMMIVLLAHARIERVKNPEGQEYDRFAPGLHTNKNGEGAGKIVQEWADEVFFCRKKKFVLSEGKGFNERTRAIGTEEREILTSDSAFASAKNRLNMPLTIDMNWSTYMHYIKANRPAKPAVQAEEVQVMPSEPVEPPGDIEGVVVNGSSKRPESPLIAEMESHFSNGE